jgi:hypothetical protein
MCLAQVGKRFSERDAGRADATGTANYGDSTLTVKYTLWLTTVLST